MILQGTPDERVSKRSFSAIELGQRCFPHLRGHSSQMLRFAGFLWASRRWAGATVLHLRLQYSDTSRGEWLSSMTHAAASLSRLEKLLLDCSHELEGDWARIQGMPLLSNVLRQAQGLRVLELFCYTFKFEAPLRNLQHLLLTQGGGEGDVDFSTLALAPNLVTVLLRNLRWDSGSGITPEHLDFRPLSRLKAVRLDFILPTQLSLPQHCWLAVVTDSLEQAKSGVWDSVRSQIRYFSTRSSGSLTAMTDLPAMLLCEPPIPQVKLEFDSFGTAESPFQLGKALAHATSLVLSSSGGMCLLVPDEASWRASIICTRQQLQWEWLSASGDIVPWLPQKRPFEYLAIEYSSLVGTGVLDLLREWPRQDVQYQGERGELTCISLTKPGCFKWFCCCGACGNCLWNLYRESV